MEKNSAGMYWTDIFIKYVKDKKVLKIMLLGEKNRKAVASKTILILWTHWFVAVVLVKLVLP